MYNQLSFNNGQITINKESRSDTMFTILMWFVWSSIFRVCFQGVLRRIVGSGALVDAITNVIIIGLIIGSIKFFLTSINKFDYLIFVFFILVYFVSGMMHPITQEYVFDPNTIFVIFIENAPFFFLGCSLSGKYIDKLYHISLITIYIYLIYAFLFGRLEISRNSSSDMGAAYALLRHLALIVSYNVRRPSAGGIVTIIIGIIVLVGLGTRGSVGCIGVLLIVAYIRGKSGHGNDRVKRFAIMLPIAALAFANLNRILNWLSSILGFLGLSTRVIDAYTSSNITDGNGRDAIWAFYTGKIEQNPMGYGIGYDRVAGVSVYAHNLRLELLLSYGVILGYVIFFGLIALFLYAMFFERREENAMMIESLFCGIGFIKLFVSSSYLLEVGFFLLFGLSISTLHYNLEMARKRKILYGRYRKE